MDDYGTDSFINDSLINDSTELPSVTSDIPPTEVRHGNFRRRFRDEFSLSKFGFHYHHANAFYTSAWNMPPLMFVIYRLVVAVYSVTILTLSATLFDYSHWDYDWPIYMTNWTYLLLTIHFVLATVITLIKTGQYEAFLARRYSDIRMDSSEMLWYFQVSWLLHSIVSTAVFMVTLLFFFIVHPFSGYDSLNFIDTNTHLINSALMALEIFINAYPVRLLHFVYPLIFSNIYLIFTVIYWYLDHSHVVYPNVLDWNDPAAACTYAIPVIFLGVPFVTTGLFCLTELKSYVLYVFNPDSF